MKFYVTVGRLVRETTTVCVEADSKEQLEDELDQIHDAADTCDWESDFEFGSEPSDSIDNITVCPASEREEFYADVDIRETCENCENIQNSCTCEPPEDN